MKNCLKDNAKVAVDWNNIVPDIKMPLKTKSKPLTFQLRKVFNFLDGQQMEKLSKFNIKSIHQMLNIPLGKLLEIKLSNEQLQLLIALVKKEMCDNSISPETILEEGQPLKAIAEELEKFDANDDDDEKPLVIDETLPNISEVHTYTTIPYLM